MQVSYAVVLLEHGGFVNSLEKMNLDGLIRRMLAEDGYSSILMADNVAEAQTALASLEKTAVVLPLALLIKDGTLDAEKAGSLGAALQNGCKDSILVVIGDHAEKMNALTNDELFKTLDPARGKVENSDCVVDIRKSPGIDEIGNLLLRKMIVERRLDWLSYDKLYPAAEYLCSLYQNASAKELYTTVLEDPEKVKEMRQKVVKAYDIVPCVNIPTTALSRFGRGVKRWNEPNATNQSR